MKRRHWFRRDKHHGSDYGQNYGPDPDAPELLAEIDRTRNSMESARNHFEQVVDPTLIDCYIYELNAAQLRYQFLLRRFKRLEELRFDEF